MFLTIRGEINMGRLSMYLESFEPCSRIKIFSAKSNELLYEGEKEKMPYELADQTNIVLGMVKIQNGWIDIYINI